jgi:hypothetical protein
MTILIATIVAIVVGLIALSPMLVYVWAHVQTRAKLRAFKSFITEEENDEEKRK